LQRLQTRAQFDAVLGHRPLANTEHFALHCSDRLDAPLGQGLAQQANPSTAPFAGLKQLAIGAMVPKKWARRAVTRNLIRRQIYSLAEHHLPAQPAQAYVVRLRRTFSTNQFVAASSTTLRQAVREQLLALLAQAPTQASTQAPTQARNPAHSEKLQ
jgi:ribonuclease P protein component